MRKHLLKKKYGISIEQYDQMLADQDHRCALCLSSEHDARGGRLAVDHDHATGVVRGLLCGPCNTGLGKLGDSVDGLRRAIAYLGAVA
jgi:hypothetical protein